MTVRHAWMMLAAAATSGCGVVNSAAQSYTAQTVGVRRCEVRERRLRWADWEREI